MNPKPVRSGRTGRKGWRFRFSDPTGGRTSKTFWLIEKREAEKAFAEFMCALEKKKIGLPNGDGWMKPYTELVEKFIADSPIKTETRRNNLRRWLLKNRWSFSEALT